MGILHKLKKYAFMWVFYWVSDNSLSWICVKFSIVFLRYSCEIFFPGMTDCLQRNLAKVWAHIGLERASKLKKCHIDILILFFLQKIFYVKVDFFICKWKCRDPVPDLESARKISRELIRPTFWIRETLAWFWFEDDHDDDIDYDDYDCEHEIDKGD